MSCCLSYTVTVTLSQWKSSSVTHDCVCCKLLKQTRIYTDYMATWRQTPHLPGWLICLWSQNLPAWGFSPMYRSIPSGSVCTSAGRGSLLCCSTDHCLCWGHLERMQSSFGFFLCIINALMLLLLQNFLFSALTPSCSSWLFLILFLHYTYLSNVF